MNFEQGHIYHIYNQGNNKRKILFTRANYLFFIEKMKTCLLPYSDVLAWCLMQNHFHVMAYINKVNIPITKKTSKTIKDQSRSFNESIGIMLRSYTRAINNQENYSGSLFRKETKAICITCKKLDYPNFFNTNFGTSINVNSNNYPQICFNYIHQNPIKAGLAANLKDWEFSSAKDYFLGRKGTLVNKVRAKEFELVKGT